MEKIINRAIINREQADMRDYLIRLNHGFKRKGFSFHVYPSSHIAERILMRGIQPDFIVRAVDCALTKRPDLVFVGNEIKIGIQGIMIVLKCPMFADEHGNYLLCLVTVFHIRDKQKIPSVAITPRELTNFTHVVDLFGRKTAKFLLDKTPKVQ